MTQIILIDQGVSDYRNLINYLPADTEVFFIDADSDGLEQAAKVLEGYSNLSAVHVFSHGSPGTLQLGNSTITESSLDTLTSVFLTRLALYIILAIFNVSKWDYECSILIQKTPHFIRFTEEKYSITNLQPDFRIINKVYDQGLIEILNTTNLCSITDRNIETISLAEGRRAL